MAAILGLFVHGRVPVGVVEDDVVGGGEVDADAARPRRADEDEGLGVRVERGHQPLSHADLVKSSYFGLAVQAQVVELELAQSLLEDVQHLGHLCEDHHLLAPLLDRLKNLHHHVQLARVIDR